MDNRLVYAMSGWKLREALARYLEKKAGALQLRPADQRGRIREAIRELKDALEGKNVALLYELESFRVSDANQVVKVTLTGPRNLSDIYGRFGTVWTESRDLSLPVEPTPSSVDVKHGVIWGLPSEKRFALWGKAKVCELPPDAGESYQLQIIPADGEAEIVNLPL